MQSQCANNLYQAFLVFSYLHIKLKVVGRGSQRMHTICTISRLTKKMVF